MEIVNRSGLAESTVGSSQPSQVIHGYFSLKKLLYIGLEVSTFIFPLQRFLKIPCAVAG